MATKHTKMCKTGSHGNHSNCNVVMATYHSAVEQFTPHFYCELDTVIPYGYIIIFDGCDGILDELRYVKLRQTRELTKRLVTLNWQHS